MMPLKSYRQKWEFSKHKYMSINKIHTRRVGKIKKIKESAQKYLNNKSSRRKKKKKRTGKQREGNLHRNDDRKLPRTEGQEFRLKGPSDCSTWWRKTGRRHHEISDTGERPRDDLKSPQGKGTPLKTSGLKLCTSHTEPGDKVARASKMRKETVSSPELNTEPNCRWGGRVFELLLGRRCHEQPWDALPSPLKSEGHGPEGLWALDLTTRCQSEFQNNV